MSHSYGSKIHPVDISILPSTLQRHGTVETIPVDQLDLTAASQSYRNAEIKERELYQNSQTLQEVRWSSMRKKIPGMSSVPKRMTTATTAEIYDLQTQYMKDLRQFIRQHFHMKECKSFVPAASQKFGKIKQLRCQCGAVFMEHAGMMVKPGVNQVLEQHIVPKELQNFISRRRLDDPVPPRLPQVKWSAEESLRPTVTNTFGKIKFVNVEHVGGTKPAKYIRVANDDSVEDLFELMIKYWRIMEPQAPNLVISVVGGAKNFKLDGRMRTTFSSGLIKAAKTTSAWLISSGFNMGVMKAVGQAVQQGQSFCWDNNRMAHVLRCIGIAPWGYVRDRKVLVETDEGMGKFCAEYRTSSVILHGEPVPLNSDHTHFIFVDDGYRNRYGGVAAMRSKIEQKISQPKEVGGLGIPVVLVVVEGGTDAIADAKSSLQHRIPVVVCSGTGRAADILAYAYSHTKTTSGGVRDMSEKHQLKLKDKIYDAYGKAWKEEEIDSKVEDIRCSVQFCCQNADLMTIFNMNKAEDLDMAILSVLLKAHSGGDQTQRLTQLKLALTWNRVDIAQEEIFREDVLWTQGSLDDVLTEAIVTDKVKFMELILQQGVIMKEFLTLDRMETLYSKVPKHHSIFKLMLKLTGATELTRDSVLKLLAKLLDRHDEEFQQLEFVRDLQGGEEGNGAIQFHRPYKHLMIYAVLLHRQSLAKFSWEMGDEPVTSAIACTRLYSAMIRHITRDEAGLRDTVEGYKQEFEYLATKVLNECQHKDPVKAMMIVERYSPVWNDMTCLQIAATANDQMFLSSEACQNSISITWKQGITSGWYMSILAMLFPPLIVFCIEMMHVGIVPLKWYQKLVTFYTSPAIKFLHNSLMYIIFVLLHSYMVLTDFRPDRVTVIEVVCISWIFTYMVDAVHVLLVFPAPTFVAKIRDFYGILHYLEWINYFIAIIGFFFHIAGYFNVTKVMYSLNSVIFFVCLTKSYTAFANLGPKLVMIKRMFGELRLFILVLLLFLLAYGIASQGLLYHKRSPSWNILKDVIYFPYWQLYGEIYLDEIASDDTCIGETMNCRTFHWMVPFILAAYLMVGNILLLNLLIAIFSNVFQEVEKKSNEIWKFQLYFLAMEYDCKTFIVPPFSIFPQTLYALKLVYRKICCKVSLGHQTLGRRHLEYLQLFEKEMMTNYLRNAKAKEQVGLETTIHKLEKRVDELTKLIEDEVIGDQQTDNMNFVVTGDSQGFTWKKADSFPDGFTERPWPSVAEVLSVKDQVARSDIPAKYLGKPMLRSASGLFLLPQKTNLSQSQSEKVAAISENKEKKVAEKVEGKEEPTKSENIHSETYQEHLISGTVADKTLENREVLMQKEEEEKEERKAAEKEIKRLEKGKRREERRRRKEEKREARRKRKQREEENGKQNKVEGDVRFVNDVNQPSGVEEKSKTKVKFTVNTDSSAWETKEGSGDNEKVHSKMPLSKSATGKAHSLEIDNQAEFTIDADYDASKGLSKEGKQWFDGKDWNISGEDMEANHQKEAWSYTEYMSEESDDAPFQVQKNRRFSSHFCGEFSSEEEEKSLREKIRKKAKKAKSKKKKRQHVFQQQGESD